MMLREVAALPEHFRYEVIRCTHLCDVRQADLQNFHRPLQNGKLEQSQQPPQLQLPQAAAPSSSGGRSAEASATPQQNGSSAWEQPSWARPDDSGSSLQVCVCARSAALLLLCNRRTAAQQRNIEM